LTAEYLRDLLAYDPDTGIFTRRRDSFNNGAVRWKAGSIVGGVSKHFGYVIIGIQDFHYRAHRLAWLYVHGEWPKGLIDHINEVRHDNRLSNLRVADQSGNMHNIRAAQKNSSTGLRGVSWFSRDRRWVAQLAVNGKRLRLGYFLTADAARAAYVNAKIAHGLPMGAGETLTASHVEAADSMFGNLPL
jgi:hypothetical protein